MTRKTKYEVLQDGEWCLPRKKGFQEKCCDCGLVHRIDYRIDADGNIWFRAFRDERATAAVRRAFKFDKEKEE